MLTFMGQIKRCYKRQLRKGTNCNSIVLFVSTVRRYVTAVLAPNYKTFGTKSCVIRTKVTVVHSCQQKSIGLKFSKYQTGSDVRYICHHNSSPFTFPIFAHSCRFSVLHSLQSITPRIY